MQGPVRSFSRHPQLDGAFSNLIPERLRANRPGKNQSRMRRAAAPVLRSSHVGMYICTIKCQRRAAETHQIGTLELAGRFLRGGGDDRPRRQTDPILENGGRRITDSMWLRLRTWA
ncbi:hypothetical protein E4U61_001010 [Claviceps capensis]|nr:hypothetical protein E4U61_001010 [Claviceps capensis]